MIAAAAIFLLSLSGLAILFTLKSIEAKRQRVFAPRAREAADAFALSLKAQGVAFRLQLEKIPPATVYLIRYVLHELALAAARVLRTFEAQLHNVADMVSHKRHFEKREPRSEFLKQIEDERKRPESSDVDADSNR